MFGGAQLSVRTIFGGIRFPITNHDHHDRTNASHWIPNSTSYHHCSMVLRLGSQHKRRRFHKPIFIIRCDSFSHGRRSTNGDDDGDHDDEDYLQASLLLSETTSHYRMRRRGFSLERQRRGSRARGHANFVSNDFLHRFHNPTIFLKISCHGDFLLPIVVGEFSVETLLDAHWGDENRDSPDEFQFLRNLVEKLGYQVNMVQITERVVNTYFARLFFSKPGEKDILSVDTRPSDAINVANRCKAPIYVNKQIVITDAIRVSYGMGRVRDTKSIYDVSVDSQIKKKKKKMPVAKPESSDARVIAHVDMDCFYVQVEQRKQPTLRGLPTAVVQYNEWKGGGLIAVSYEARKYGVNRSMRGEEAKQVCPQIQLVQVPIARGKADLNTYRNAGSEVVSILARKGRCERASIDEVYLDLTDAAAKMLAEDAPENWQVVDEETLKSHILGLSNEAGIDAKENVREWLCRKDADRRDKLLACGTLIVAELRMQVLKETEFTCSAGIAHNKILAKLASAMNKPAQQTVVPFSSVKGLLDSLPIKKM